MTLEDYNIASDPRSRGPATVPVLSFYGCVTCGHEGESCDCPAEGPGAFVGGDIEIELPMTWAVCPVCNGNGKHVNPSIDASGISAEDFAEDPDFADQYMRGTYDVTCNRCRGRTTVPVADWDALTESQRTLYEEQLRFAAEDRACQLAELRVGA